MKKMILIFPFLLVAMIVFSFVIKPTDEIKITVTAEKETLFDMYGAPEFTKFEGPQQNSIKAAKGLKTPYEFTVNSDYHFIFKSQDQRTILRVKAQRGNGSVIGEEPIVVILINGEKTTTFGIN